MGFWKWNQDRKVSLVWVPELQGRNVGVWGTFFCVPGRGEEADGLQKQEWYEGFPEVDSWTLLVLLSVLPSSLGAPFILVP